MFATWASGFIPGAFFLVLGAIVTRLEFMAEHARDQSKLLQAIAESQKTDTE